MGYPIANSQGQTRPAREIDYGPFTCDICGKSGRKTSPRQVRHTGPCARVKARKWQREWLATHKVRDAAHQPIRRDLWDARLHELDRLIAAGLGDRKGERL